ncbi:MAG: hypothetical protein M0P20_09740 [Methanocorpusculum sp.]|jgi:hypothetical protein|nr:hypothetical protein [Methanocorpusculum sp.]
MPLTSLLLSALTPKSTLEENNIGITIDRNALNKAEETLLLFESDRKDTHFRSIWLPQQGCGDANSLCCDGILFYHSLNTGMSGTICFVELKGSDLSHAVKQIEHTYNVINAALTKAKIQTCKIKWKVVIISNVGKPKNYLNIIKPLTDKFEKGKEKNVEYQHMARGNKFPITKFIQK